MTADVPCTPPDTVAAVERLVGLYEQLSRDRLAQLGACYATDAHFKDPFNDVRGVAAITRIFEHMFETVQDPRFVVTRTLVQDREAFLAWEFHFRLRRWRPGAAQCIHGGTLVRFDAQALVCDHRDYWDAAEELYEKLPLLGALMRWLRRAGAVPQK